MSATQRESRDQLDVARVEGKDACVAFVDDDMRSVCSSRSTSSKSSKSSRSSSTSSRSNSSCNSSCSLSTVASIQELERRKLHIEAQLKQVEAALQIKQNTKNITKVDRPFALLPRSPSSSKHLHR